MAAVMTDRTAFRRLAPELHAAELALREWGQWRSRDQPDNGLPRAVSFYSAIKRDWLDAARADPPAEPEWMPRMVAFFQSQPPITQRFMVLVWQYGRTPQQARIRLHMSENRSRELVRTIRQHVDRYVLACGHV